MQSLVISMGDECLSDTYISAKSKLLWKCSQGHEWFARPDNIRHGRWCPKCKNVKIFKYLIEDMVRLASKRGGTCISRVFNGVKVKLEWECSLGHRWKATPDNIIRGTWCIKCRPTRPTLSIEEMRLIAEKRGGKCISNDYVNLNTPLLWQCDNGHEWWAVPASIKFAKSWCPYCSSTSIGEAICRQVLEATFGVAFPRKRPAWLLSAGGLRLELDGYNAGQKIAFEYQGPHHYGEWHYHKGQKDYELQVVRDQMKQVKCKENNIILITIKQFDSLHDIDRIFMAIQNSVDASGVSQAVVRGLIRLESNELGNLKDIARQNGGKLLSAVYKGNNEKLEWECAEGHKWNAVPQNILRAKSWCPKCARVALLNIEEMKVLAKKRGGQCLSKEYIGISSPLKWECAVGHQWEVAPAGIKFRNTWCPYCAGKRKTIEDMDRLASARGGTCISVQYKNPTTKLAWKCSYAHEFYATPNKVQQGSWCPICAKQRNKYNHSRLTTG